MAGWGQAHTPPGERSPRWVELHRAQAAANEALLGVAEAARVLLEEPGGEHLDGLATAYRAYGEARDRLDRLRREQKGSSW